MMLRSVARVAADDAGLLVGDGVFETVRADGGVPALFREHMERLAASLQAVRLEIPWTPDGIEALVQRLLVANDLVGGTARIRITVTRGGGAGGKSGSSASHGITGVTTTDPTLLISATYEPLDTRRTKRRRRLSRHPRSRLPLHQSDHELPCGLWQRASERRALLRRGSSTAGSAEGAQDVRVDASGWMTPRPEYAVSPGIARGAVLALARNACYDTREGGIDRRFSVGLARFS